MPKVLQVVSSLSRNGTETFIMNIVKYTENKELKFDFLVFSNDKDGYYEEAIKLGIKIYQLPNRRKNYWLYHKLLYNFFKTHSSEYCAIHFHFCYLSLLFPFVLSKIYKIPIRIIHSHSSSWTGGYHNYLLHIFFRRLVTILMNRYLACSPLAAKWFFPSKVYMNKCKIVTNGIDFKKFKFNDIIRKKYRNDYNYDEKNLVIGHVGYFEHVKNHDFIIDVFNHLAKQNENMRLLLIGSGSLKNNIKNKVVKLNLSEKVIMLENRNDVNCLLQAIDVFIFPSLFEGLPLALIEAQCSGVPVFASDTISTDSKILDTFKFLSLQSGSEYWAKTILNSSLKRDYDAINNIISKGFSISTTTEKLSQIYLNKI